MWNCDKILVCIISLLVCMLTEKNLGCELYCLVGRREIRLCSWLPSLVEKCAAVQNCWHISVKQILFF
jgi:hypothetical protein